MTLNENGIKFYTEQEGAICATKSETVFAIGTNPIGNRRECANFSGKVYSVRLYNRALTDEEVKNNYEIDKLKYRID